MPFQLADLGYDVWMGNNRGTDYSQQHKTLSATDDADKYWQFSWAEMGRYDTPAIIDQVKAQTGKEKLRYIGYSQGTVQMHYLLAHREEDYVQHHISKIIQLAPCTVSTGIPDADGKPNLPVYQSTEWQYMGMGIYNVAGPNWDANLKKGCDTFGDGWCGYFSAYTTSAGIFD